MFTNGRLRQCRLHYAAEKFENVALFLRLGLPSTLILHENAALFLRLGLPFTLIRHENAAFQKRSSNRRNLKTPAFPAFSCGRKSILKTVLFENDVVTTSLAKFSSNKNPKMTGGCCVFKFFGYSEDGASF